METLFFEKTGEIKKNKKLLEKKLNILITIKERDVSFEGDSMAEYEAFRILEAMQFGFSAKKALLLLDEDMVFRKVNMKHFTKRNDMSDVRARIIGKEGKTKKTIEQISGCYLLIREDNTLGIICSGESIEDATTAIINLIKGSKAANVYRFLEKINTIRKSNKTDLGLKIKRFN
jgi:ribosomal RNA assembly protein